MSSASTRFEEKIYENGELIVRKYKNCVNFINNRPKNLGAIKCDVFPIIDKLFQQIASSNAIHFTIFTSNGRAFCAGGDLHQITHAVAHQLERSIEFVWNEYRMDRTLNKFPKPSIVIIDGLVMGGGCGVACPHKNRICTENTIWAMPECDVGHYPDVGTNYYMSRIPGHIGEFLAVTGYRMNAKETLHYGMGTHFIQSKNIPALMDELTSAETTMENAKEIIEKILDKYSEEPPNLESELIKNEKMINDIFGEERAEDIVKRLKQVNTKFSNAMANKILTGCPLTTKIALLNIKRARGMTIEQCLKSNYTLSTKLFHFSNNFVEGVRAKLKDRDNNPKWVPSTLEQVTKKEVEFYFEPWHLELHFDSIIDSKL